MNLTLTFNEILTLVTLIVAGLGIMWQMHQLSKESKLIIFMGYTQRYQEILIHFPIDIAKDDFNLEVFLEKEENKDELLLWMRAYFNICSEEYQLGKDKLIDKHIWKLWDAGIVSSMSKPSFQNAWKRIEVCNYYNEDFHNYITRIINSSK